jgi:hypothetical protein
VNITLVVMEHRALPVGSPGCPSGLTASRDRRRMVQERTGRTQGEPLLRVQAFKLSRTAGVNL